MHEIDVTAAQKPRRVEFIDELRGLDIIVMVLYHALYDLVFIFGVNMPSFQSFFMPYVQPCIAGVFILLSGISCRYSKSNLKRGAKTFLLGMALTTVTLLFMRSEAIYFGILHFMGTSMMLFALLRRFLDKIPAHYGAIISVLLYTVTRHLPEGWVGIKKIIEIPLPAQWYTNPMLLPFGFYGAGSDYFPLIPFFFLFLSGAYFGVFFYNNEVSDWFYQSRSKALSKIGRHTIWIYMLHQPILMGIFTLVFNIAR